MSRTIRNKKQRRSCDCDRCRDGRRYSSTRDDANAKAAIKEIREKRER